MDRPECLRRTAVLPSLASRLPALIPPDPPTRVLEPVTQSPSAIPVRISCSPRRTWDANPGRWQYRSGAHGTRRNAARGSVGGRGACRSAGRGANAHAAPRRRNRPGHLPRVDLHLGDASAGRFALPSPAEPGRIVPGVRIRSLKAEILTLGGRRIATGAFHLAEASADSVGWSDVSRATCPGVESLLLPKRVRGRSRAARRR